MNIGQLFVSLGVKGSDKSIGSIKSVKGSLKDTASVGLEAKAAIIGAVYAMERLFSKSGQYGTDLTNLNATLGISTRTLQEYQYAARQVGVSNEEVAGSFANIQKIITDVKLNKGAPESMALLGKLTGMTAQDFFKADFNPEILIQKLQEAGQKLKDAPGLKNKLFADFGMGTGMSAALSRNAFRPEVLSRAPTYSENEIANLDRANIAWSNLGNKIQMAIGHFNAANGGKIVGEISKVFDEVMKLVNALGGFDKALKNLTGSSSIELLGKVFEGWRLIFEALTSGINSIVGMTNEEAKNPSHVAGPIAGVMNKVATNVGSEAATIGKYMWDQLVESYEAGKSRDATATAKPVPVKAVPNSAAPTDNSTGKAPTSIGPSPLPTTNVQGAAPTAEPPAQVPMWEGKKEAPTWAPPGVKSAAENAAPKPDLKLVPKELTSPSANAAPTAPAVITTQNNNTVVNQNLNFQHEGKNAKQTGDSVKKAVQGAFRQMSGLAQGT